MVVIGKLAPVSLGHAYSYIFPMQIHLPGLILYSSPSSFFDVHVYALLTDDAGSDMSSPRSSNPYQPRFLDAHPLRSYSFFAILIYVGTSARQRVPENDLHSLGLDGRYSSAVGAQLCIEHQGQDQNGRFHPLQFDAEESSPRIIFELDRLRLLLQCEDVMIVQSPLI